MRPFTTVLMEALFIGLMLQILFMGLTKYIYKGVGVLIIAGALIHVLFEYSPFGNINEKWCKIIFD
ncbi:hypothetical protein [Bathycoccus sp. RCC716 virus 1]|uniref:Uncharacterized protein n=1 Tax=Bathycoccus sp. RCC716 virus 1 TaxID=2530038 RepID=A0A7S6NYS8_9PHYC|nr:hypothetical protein [Bathycoccus sp. RCC716 virus 1]